MRSSTTRFAVLAASLVATAKALDGIVVPETVAADSAFNATFVNGNSDSYRVFLAAALTGANGPTCYLVNSTDLSSPISITIPAGVGPSADYYSIAIADLTASQGATYSNRFSFTGGSGNYTDYEQHLGGAPFWDANSLPCSSYACARACAQTGYPDDLTQTAAYDTMKNCILKCPGVSAAAAQTAPALASSTGSATRRTTTATTTADEALITLSSGGILTAVEMTVTSGGSTITEAVLGGSMTLTLGGAAATVSNEAVSLAKEGVQVGSSTTVPFSTMVQTVTTVVSTDSATTGSASVSSANAATTSKAAASRHDVAIAGLASVAGLAVFML